MQDILSRRKFFLSGLLFVAGSTGAFARDGEGTKRFNAQKGTNGRPRQKYPDFFEPWDDDYDRDWERMMIPTTARTNMIRRCCRRRKPNSTIPLSRLTHR